MNPLSQPSVLDDPQNDPKLVLEALTRKKEEELAWEALKPKAAYCRVEDWMADLPVSPGQRLVLGRIWSFQAHTKGTGECYESLSSIARVVGFDKSNVKKHLVKMTDMGILIKTDRGRTKPPSYRIDLVCCQKLIKQTRAAREEKRPDVSAARRAQWNAKHDDGANKLF